MGSTPLYRLPNIAAFIAFRVFFNARFYYPVFALMFLEFGLTLSQFSVSNLLWAASIVMLEVPSGALADILGRRKLVIFASLLMILEMGVLLVAKPQPGTMLLVLFCLNRILSGAGEAMASGADEALAFDSLKEAGEEDRWSEVLEWQTRLSSVAFFTAMLLGAAAYDPEVVNRAADFIGWETAFTKQDTLKWPIWLTLGTAVISLLAALSMTPTEGEGGEKVGSPWQKVVGVGRRLLNSRSLLMIVLAAVLFDQTARISMTMGSKTFSAYGIEEGWFGVIGAVMALTGAFVSRPARRLAENASKQTIFWIVVGLTFVGLLGQALVPSAWALLFVVALSAVMSLIGFFASFYLNKMADSEERATLLSFKGLACNLGFGVVSLYYAGVSGLLPTETSEDYLHSLLSLPAYFGLGLVLYVSWYLLSGSNERQSPHEPPA